MPLTAFLALNSPEAAGAALSVTNYGTDSGSCGPVRPCRSISRAIENASPGDSIWVGAGHYGNISGDPSFTGPGDEQPQSVDTVKIQGCMVCVVKPVHIRSYNGAAVTFIDGGSSPLFEAVVIVIADGATFGSPGHGFTITGGNGFGVLNGIGVVVDLEHWNASTTGVTVSGNVDLQDGTGFRVIGPLENAFRGCPGPPYCTRTPFRGQIVLSGNQAIGSGTGFLVEPIVAAVGQPLQFFLQDNTALGAGTGFVVRPGDSGYCDECDRFITAADVFTTHNVATGGGVGFWMQRAGPVSRNTASYNSQFGFLTINGSQFSNNSAIGNRGPGLIAALEIADPAQGAKPAFLTPFTQNNFFANDRSRPSLALGDYGPPYDYNPGPSARCGILNIGAIWQTFDYVARGPPPPPPVPGTVLQATQNYWGSANGPAANGAGDAAGGACDQNNAVTVSKPFATGVLTISTLP